jgi:dysferlin
MSLVVEVKSASALPNLERFSKSDPMVVLIFQGVKNKTKVIDNNLDPVWNERFEWALSTAPSPSEIIQIDIFDHETLGKNK